MKCPVCDASIFCQNCGDVELKTWKAEYDDAEEQIKELKRLLHKKHGTMPDEYEKLQARYDELDRRVGITKLAVKKLLGDLDDPV